MAKRRGKRKKPAGRPPQPVAAPRPARSRWVWVGIAMIGVGAALIAWRFVARGGERAAPAERLHARVIKRHPHQTDAFTQGLVWHDGVMYESTGGKGESSLREVELETGEVVRRLDSDPDLFAEGLALAGDLLYQLSWQNGRALVFRRADFEPVREHRYEGEGWGLCHDGKDLVMSDGSDRLAFRDPDTFAVRRTVHVKLDGNPVMRLNELECVAGAVWANIWREETIVRIDPVDGHVTAVVDAGGLLTAEERRRADVLNGIAWMPERGHFLVTGKRWPWIFEVDFEPGVRRRGGGR